MAFNPMVLDANLSSISSYLSPEQKIEVLLFAMQQVPLDAHSRVPVENAVQSCLHISQKPVNLARARVLRAKSRLACGMGPGAQQDLQAALLIDPENDDASLMLRQRFGRQYEKFALQRSGNDERFSSEVWREIAKFLPRRDQRTLLFVPYTPSRVATQLLFERIDLHFHDTGFNVADKISQDKVNADVLTRIISDPGFACLIKSLRITTDADHRPIPFQAGMLENALPKLINLRSVRFAADGKKMSSLCRALHSVSRRIRELDWSCWESFPNSQFLDFRHLIRITIESGGGDPTQIHNLISQNRESLRAITLRNTYWTFPVESISIRNLKYLDLSGKFTESQTLCEIFSNGHQLEFLAICCNLHCKASSYLKKMQSCLPFLRHFMFKISEVSTEVIDNDLFPALIDLLRNRTQLKSLKLSVQAPKQPLFGFDASAWGLLPSLPNLTCLGMSYPKDLSPALASWLIPRKVRALSLDTLSTLGTHRSSFLTTQQIRLGLPEDLRFIELNHFHDLNPEEIIESFPTARVLRVAFRFWTITRASDGTIKLEEWPRRIVSNHVRDHLEWHGCEEAFGGQYGYRV